MLKNLEKITLKNGFEVYHLPQNLGSNVVSVNLFYKVGSGDESRGISGISHMLEHLNFKSTTTHKAGEFDSIVKSIGGVDNASTGFDYTHYYVQCASKELAVVVNLFADMMANLALSEEEFLPEREVVLEERRLRTENDPFGALYWEFFKNAFSQSYGWTPIGFEEDIKGFTIEAIREFHARFYQPQNAFLLVCGDASKEEVFSLAKTEFEKIANKSVSNSVLTKEVGEKFEPKSVVVTKPSEVEMLLMGFQGVPFDHEDAATLDALASLLSNGKSSVFERVLNEELGLVSQVEAESFGCKKDGVFLIFAVLNEGVKSEQVLGEVMKILEDFEISEQAFWRLKNQLKMSLAQVKLKSSSLASTIGGYIARGDLTPFLRLEESLQGLSKERLKECAKRYFTAKTLTSVSLKCEKQSKRGADE